MFLYIPPSKLQKEALSSFWAEFGGGKNSGRTYGQDKKLLAMIKMGAVFIKWRDNKALMKTRRAKFEEVKRRRHNRLSHKYCFICDGSADVRHHIIWLKNGGINSKRNIVSLCYGCHAKIHPWLKG